MDLAMVRVPASKVNVGPPQGTTAPHAWPRSARRGATGQPGSARPLLRLPGWFAPLPGSAPPLALHVPAEGWPDRRRFDPRIPTVQPVECRTDQGVDSTNCRRLVALFGQLGVQTGPSPVCSASKGEGVQSRAVPSVQSAACTRASWSEIARVISQWASHSVSRVPTVLVLGRRVAPANLGHHLGQLTVGEPRAGTGLWAFVRARGSSW